MTETKEYIEAVAKRTKEARKKAEFKTQDSIAKAMGIDRARYAKFETERIIAKELIAKFCELTKVSANWLLTGAGPMDTGAQYEQKKQELYELMDGVSDLNLETDPFIRHTLQAIKAKVEEKK